MLCCVDDMADLAVDYRIGVFEPNIGAMSVLTFLDASRLLPLSLNKSASKKETRPGSIII